jgi:hypothetical protein
MIDIEEEFARRDDLIWGRSVTAEQESHTCEAKEWGLMGGGFLI